MVPICDGILELRYAANDDTAFSLLHALGVAHTPGMLLLLPVVAIAGLVSTWIVAGRKGASPPPPPPLAQAMR